MTFSMTLFWELAVLFSFLSSCFASTTKIEYNLDKTVSPDTTSSVSSSTFVVARSDIECSTLCSAADSSPGTSCKSWAFAAATGRCFLSGNRTFGFGGAVALGASVYRGPVDPITATAATVSSPFLGNCTELTIGSRTFCVIQQRVSDRVSFARSWSEYENGFGDSENFWIGLKTIYNMTGGGATPRLFRAEALNYQNGKLYVCEYSSFSIANASAYYQLSVSGYLANGSNTSADSFYYNNNKQFSTMDAGPKTSCSQSNSYAGWWFGSCTYPNPNGYFNLSVISSSVNSEKFMQWLYAADDTSYTRPMLRSIRLMLEVRSG